MASVKEMIDMGKESFVKSVLNISKKGEQMDVREEDKMSGAQKIKAAIIRTLMWPIWKIFMDKKI